MENIRKENIRSNWRKESGAVVGESLKPSQAEDPDNGV